MEKIEWVLREWLGFFFEGDRYRMVNRQEGPRFKDALVDIASELLVWRIVNDRSQIILRFRPSTGEYKYWEWYSIDLLVRLFDPTRQDSAALTAELSEWVKLNLDEIEARFSESRREATEERLNELMRIRADELFGPVDFDSAP